MIVALMVAYFARKNVSFWVRLEYVGTSAAPRGLAQSLSR